MALIQENSYWFQDGEGDDAKMAALCGVCHRKQQKGVIWEGKRLGYGDYDLFCNSCKNAIHIRDKNDKTKTTSEDSRG